MTKTAIFFASKHGTTERLAHLIAERLNHHEISIFNLKDNPKVDLGSYHQIIIGGSVHAGQIQKRVRTFCQEHLLELLEKPLGLFLCGMNEPQYESQLQHAYPDLLRHHAISCQVLGGEFLFPKMNFLEKIIVRKVSGITQSVSHIRMEALEAFAQAMSKN